MLFQVVKNALSLHTPLPFPLFLYIQKKYILEMQHGRGERGRV